MSEDSAAPAAAATTTGGAKLALLAGAIAVGGAAAGFGLGATGWFGGDDPGADSTPTSVAADTLRLDSATFYSCSDDDGVGAPLGDLRRGDEVWVIGRSGTSWLVIRHPQRLSTPAWMRVDDLIPGSDPSGLEDLTCEQAASAAEEPAPTSQPADTSTTTLAPTTTVTASTSTAVPTTPPPTTAPDSQGPAISITPDRTYVYEGTVNCPDQVLDLTVQVSDPSAPVSVQSVTWQVGTTTGAATSLGGNRYRIGPVSVPAPVNTTLTITVTARDGRGNTSSATADVTYRAVDGTCTPG